MPLLVWLALMTQASAEETGYVFVSNEGADNIAVIDPYRAYQVIKWIATDHGPRDDMKFRDKGKTEEPHSLRWVAPTTSLLSIQRHGRSATT